MSRRRAIRYSFSGGQHPVSARMAVAAGNAANQVGRYGVRPQRPREGATTRLRFLIAAAASIVTSFILADFRRPGAHASRRIA